MIDLYGWMGLAGGPDVFRGIVCVCAAVSRGKSCGKGGIASVCVQAVRFLAEGSDPVKTVE